MMSDSASKYNSASSLGGISAYEICTGVASNASISLDYSQLRENIQGNIEIKETQIKKPDVDPNTRTRVVVENGSIVMKTYRDGYYTGQKALLPEIEDVIVYNSNAVEVKFKNDKRKYVASAAECDQFNLEVGIMICIMKKMLNVEENTQVFNKILQMGVKVYKNKITSQAKEVLKAQEEERIRKNHQAKAARKKAKRLERKRQERIEEIAEGIILAGMKMDISDICKKALNPKKKKTLLEKKGSKKDE